MLEKVKLPRYQGILVNKCLNKLNYQLSGKMSIDRYTMSGWETPIKTSPNYQVSFNTPMDRCTRSGRRKPTKPSLSCLKASSTSKLELKASHALQPSLTSASTKLTCGSFVPLLYMPALSSKTAVRVHQNPSQICASNLLDFTSSTSF